MTDEELEAAVLKNPKIKAALDAYAADPSDVVEEEAAPAPAAIPRPRAPKAPAPSAVVGSGETDPVYLSKAVYGKRQKSLTVHHIQRRLHELGFHEAYSDIDGAYLELTKSSVLKYQESRNYETPATGIMDAETFSDLFKADPNVTVVLA